MASYLRPRRGKKSTAISQNIILKRGEIFFEVPDDGVGTGPAKMKMGDGVTPYADLPYALNPANLGDYAYLKGVYLGESIEEPALIYSENGRVKFRSIDPENENAYVYYDLYNLSKGSAILNPTDYTSMDSLISIINAMPRGKMLFFYTWTPKIDFPEEFAASWCVKVYKPSEDTNYATIELEASVMVDSDTVSEHRKWLGYVDNNAISWIEVALGEGITTLYQITPAFDPNKSYTAGEYVLYNGILYKFTSDKAPGPWDASKVYEDITLADEISLLRNIVAGTTAVLDKTNWVQEDDGTYSNTVLVDNMTEDTIVDVDLYDDGTATDEQRLQYDQYIVEYYTGQGAITAYATHEPTVDIPILIRGKMDMESGGSGTGNTYSVDLTLAEYQELEAAGLVDPETTYYITDGEGGGGASSGGGSGVEVTQAEYNQLKADGLLDPNTVYYITDADGVVRAADIIYDASGTTTVKEEIDTLKQSFQDGCSTIAAAITEMGVTTAENASPDTMANNIKSIQSGIDIDNISTKTPTKTKTFTAVEGNYYFCAVGVTGTSGNSTNLVSSGCEIIKQSSIVSCDPWSNVIAQFQAVILKATSTTVTLYILNDSRVGICPIDLGSKAFN